MIDLGPALLIPAALGAGLLIGRATARRHTATQAPTMPRPATWWSRRVDSLTLRRQVVLRNIPSVPDPYERLAELADVPHQDWPTPLSPRLHKLVAFADRGGLPSAVGWPPRIDLAAYNDDQPHTPAATAAPAIDWHRGEPAWLSPRWWWNLLDRAASHPRLDQLCAWLSRHEPHWWRDYPVGRRRAAAEARQPVLVAESWRMPTDEFHAAVADLVDTEQDRAFDAGLATILATVARTGAIR